ncbi:hypothetical protein AKJ16_DCAP27147 [Drosera capensis]
MTSSVCTISDWDSSSLILICSAAGLLDIVSLSESALPCVGSLLPKSWTADFFVSPEGAFPIFLMLICLDRFHGLPSFSERFIFCLRRILIILPNSGSLALTDLAS